MIFRFILFWILKIDWVNFNYSNEFVFETFEEKVSFEDFFLTPCFVKSENSKFSRYFNYLTIISAPTCILGIIGNILSILITIRRDRGSAKQMWFLLKYLSFANIIQLLIATIFHGIPDIFCNLSKWCEINLYDKKTESSIIRKTLYNLVYWIVSKINIGETFGQEAHSLALYIILLIAIERLFAISKPLRTHRLKTVQIRIILSIIILLIFIAYLPDFFGIDRTIATFDFNNSQNFTPAGFYLVFTSSPCFLMGYHIILFIVFQLIPIFTITSVNIFLIKNIHNKRFSFSNRSITQIPNLTLFKGSLLAIMTVTAFFIGEIPMFGFNLKNLISLAYELHSKSEENGIDQMNLENQNSLMYQVAARILDLTACSNIILYFFFGSKFRGRMKSFFRSRRRTPVNRKISHRSTSSSRFNTFNIRASSN